jgi:putative transcriptional regulator
LHDLLKQIEHNDQEEKNVADESEPTDQALLAEVESETKESLLDNSLEQLVLSGGPISQNRGFVLHRTQPGWQSSLALSDDIMITTSKDILMALGTEKAPEQFMVTLGYAGWGPGQLEAELHANSWLTIDADSDILFNTPIEQRWQKATKKLGIDIAHLSTDIGHA